MADKQVNTSEGVEKTQYTLESESSSEDGHFEQQNDTNLVDWSDEEERAVRRKIDFHCFPMFWVIFSLCLLDRANMPFAFNAGMAKDLKLMIGDRYSIALLLFFPTNFLFEIPSNVIIRKVGARGWITMLIFFWGVTTMCKGFSLDWKALAGLQAMLGAFEAGLLPGAIFLQSCWYKPYELAKRVAALWMVSQLVSAFGPILAYGLSFISVGNGIFASGWRWIFIVEGLITITAALLTPFFLIDFPERAKFLNDRERHIANMRVRLSREGKEVRHPSIKEIGVMLMDWKLLIMSLQYFIAASSIYSLGFFGPIILLEDLGFSYAKAQLLSTPPVVFAVPCSLAASWLSDKIKLRWPIVCFQALVAVVGLVIVLYAKPAGVRYFGLFIAHWGVMSNLPSLLSYVPNQVARPEKQGLASAAVISAGAIGGICGSTIFRRQDAPTYFPGMWSTIGMQLLLIGMTFCLSMYYKRQNSLADAGKIGPLQRVVGFRYAP